jgi:hypothetical protein
MRRSMKGHKSQSSTGEGERKTEQFLGKLSGFLFSIFTPFFTSLNFVG